MQRSTLALLLASALPLAGGAARANPALVGSAPIPEAVAPAEDGIVLPATLSAGPMFRAHPKPRPPLAPPPSDITLGAPTLPDPMPAALQAALASLDTGKSSRREAERLALTDFYSARAFAPLYIQEGVVTPAGRAVLARLARAGEDGLDPAAYRVTSIAADGSVVARGADGAAAAEVDLQRAVLTFARHAQSGRLSPRAVSPLITADPEVPEPAEVLVRVSTASDPAAALDSFNPPHEQFRRLKAELAKVRASGRSPDDPPIPRGPALEPGDIDPRVANVRTRLKLPATGAPDYYDAALVDAVKAAQKKAGLKPDGRITGRTLSALEGHAPVNASEADIVASMERWRWLPRDLGSEHVFVNIPDYQLKVVRNGRETYRGRVIVGKDKTQTPIFSNAIRFLVVNPYWNVPISIASKEMLPNIRANPNAYFSRRGYEVVMNGKVVSPSSVSWNEKTIRQVRIRQKPGDDNALGNIKFMFPNEHAVYLHDTPSRGLFANATRAYSHGCVRVDNPFEFADALFAEEPGWNGARLKSLIGGRERRVDLARPVPVHLAYFTHWVNDHGRVEVRPDLYGHHARTKKLLGY
ncbi:L,D-transpeptidase family protein [Segnochrobactraceae bacterium EtOH-i3]